MSRAPDAPSRTARVAGWLTAAAVRRPWLTLAGCLLAVAAGAALAVARLEFHTQRNDLLSAEKECQKRWQTYLDAFGDDDDLVVVIKGTDRNQMTAAADAVADRLRGRPDLFDRVFHQVDLRPVYPKSLQLLPPDEIAAIDRRLDGMAPLLGRLGPVAWQALSVQALLAQAANAQASDTPLAPADRDLLAQLPAILGSAADTLRNPDAYHNPWSVGQRDAREELLQQPQYFFTPDAALCLVLARPHKTAGSFTPAREACAAARAMLADARRSFPDLELGLTGLPVLETDEMAASDEDSTRASLLALLGVAGLYLVVYRGIRYPMLTVGTLAVGTGWALGWATLTVGHLNILSATFAVMIIGMGDYGVLWVARYDDERAVGKGVAEALAATARHAGPGILTAAATTALAFFATLFADFRAVAELGWIAGCGVLCCALACLTFLPAMLTIVEGRRAARVSGPVEPSTHANPTTGDGFHRPADAGRSPARSHRPADAGRSPRTPILQFPADGRPFLPSLAARPRRTLAVGTLLLAVTAGFAVTARYDANLLNMQADGLDSVRWENELTAHTAGATWDALSIARTPDDALAVKARYEALPGVSRVVEAASFRPRQPDAVRPLVESVRRKLAGLPNSVPEGLPSDPAAVKRLAAKFPDTGPLRAALDRPNAADRLTGFDRRLRADLHADLLTLRAVADPAPLTAADLPPAFRERYIGANGEYLVRAFAAGSLWEFDELARFTAAAQTVDPRATGKAFRTLEGLRQMKAGFERAGLLALAVIVGVLWLDFRDRRTVLLGLLPLVAGVVGAIGVMAAVGVPLNPANLIALPLIVGVGVDNGVHVLHDHAARRSGAYRLGAATGRGIAMAGLTTVLGFGTLAVSRHRGMASLGLALALGVAFCMAAALLLLPAVLRLLDRRPTAPAANPLRRAG